jgi:hypothetical protein
MIAGSACSVAAVVVAAVLFQPVAEQTYAAGDPPESITGEFSFDRTDGIVGWNCSDYYLCAHDWNVSVGAGGFTGYNYFGSYNARAHCMDGLAYWFPPKDTYSVSMTLVSVDKASRIIKYTGAIGHDVVGGGNQRLFVEAYFTWNFTPSQPVTESLAPKTSTIGQALTDEITVFEADGDTGYKLTSNSKWPKDNGIFKSVQVRVDAYGPFTTVYPARNPLDSQIPQNSYFSMDETTETVSIDGSKVTIIGDEIANASKTHINDSLNRVGLTNMSNATINAATGRTLANAVTLVNDGTISITDYVVLALGSNDFGLDANGYKNGLIGLISAVKNKGAKYIVIMTPFNASGKSSADNMLVNEAPMSKVFAFEGVVNDIVQNDSNLDLLKNIALLKWTGGGNPNDAAKDWSLYKCADKCDDNTPTPTPGNNVYQWRDEMLKNDGLTPTELAGAAYFAEALAVALTELVPGGSRTYTGGPAQKGWGFATGPVTNNYPGGEYSDKKIGSFSFNTGNKTTAPGTNGWAFDGTFSGSNNWPAGKYYFVTNIAKGGSNDWMVLNNWYSPFAEETETTVVKFQPYVASNVLTKYVDASKGESITDRITSYATDTSQNANSSTPPRKDDSYWKDIPVNVCVKAWGPYQYEQPKDYNNGVRIDNNSKVPDGISPKTPKATICTDGGTVEKGNFTEAGEDRDFIFDTNGWTPGYYYFTEHIIRGDQDQNVRELIDGDYNSKFNPSNPEAEEAVVKFQPYFTSKVAQTFIDDIDNNSNGNKQIVDRISSHAAKSIDDANNNADIDDDGYGGVDKYWLNNTPVKVCVKVWGPYQRAQDTDYNNGVRIDSDSKVPDGISPKTPKATICSDNTSFGTGGSVAGGNFTKANDTRDFIFDTSSWTPGYYYFTEHMLLSQQTAADLMISDWNSKFNPMSTGDEYEDEATIEKFQLKTTSQTVSSSGVSGLTINTDIIGDTNHNGRYEGTGEPAKNDKYTTWDRDAIPVLKPTDAYIEDSFDIRAYDTNKSDDTTSAAKTEYWLKDLNGDYITFYVCATIYGPYQQPQGSTDPDGKSKGSWPRSPVTGIGQSTLPTIPNNYWDNQDTRQHCFWTDKKDYATDNDGLVGSPTQSGGTKDHGGPGTYTVRWDNQGDKYFQPGYYYVVWSVNSDSSGHADGVGDNDAEYYCTTQKNNCNTIVNIGDSKQIQQKNGDFLESSWWSPFGEQTESFYSQFQPIAKSTIPEFTNTNENDLLGNGWSVYFKGGMQYRYENNGFYIDNGERIAVVDPPICSDTVTNECIIKLTSNPSSDNISQRKKSTAGDGIVLECDENKYNYTINYVDDPENYPKEKLHCQNVTDQIYLGAVNDKAINNRPEATATHEVSSTGTSKGYNNQDVNNQDDRYWPKNKDGIFEPVKFQVKLYGPFKYPYARTPSAENKAGWAGDNVVTIVPPFTDDKAFGSAVFAQPIAESCVISTANAGPNWDGSPEAWNAVFTQDISSCDGNGSPSVTEIELTPGFYVSVVEIVRDDIENTNPDFRRPECKATIDNSKTQCATQWNTRPHNMIIEDRFTSAWGDKEETLLVPIPLYVVTRRGNSDVITYPNQATINDQYWVAGFSGEYVDDKGEKHRWTDIWGDKIPLYGSDGYSGKEGYVTKEDNEVETQRNVPPKEYKYSHSEESKEVENYYQKDIAGDIHVKLYGPYPLENRPNENDEYCVANKLVRRGTWQLPAKDTPLSGSNLNPAPPTLYEKGWYVFQYTYSGGDRITNIKTQCGDTNEMFQIVNDEIRLTTSADSDEKTAPTRITDTVEVTGLFQESDKGSIVKLSLYKRAGEINSPGINGMDGEPVCWLKFTVDSAVAYTTKDYTDDKGYILPDGYGEGRCYTETGGYYYWIEEFLRPGSNWLDPVDSDYIQPIGKGEWPESIDINPPPTPEVTTDADPTTSVNRPFHDTATVTNIPDNNDKVYKLWFTAYGPFADGRVDCSSQLIYSNESSKIEVTKNGRYESDYITVSSNGIVYWVEHLEDEDGNIVDQGECGTRRENTYVVGPEVPPTTPFEPFQPLYPDAGYISQQVGKVVALGIMSMLGAWQLTNKNSWLLRKNNSR